MSRPAASRERDERDLFTRRGALGALGGLVVFVAGLVGLRVSAHSPRIRPPGAAPGPEFLRKCIRCQRCATVCPIRAIRFSSSMDLYGSETPYIDAARRGCALCMRCTQVCPTGALTAVEANAGAIAALVRMGRPELDRDRCIALDGSGECRACYYVCPYADRAVRLEGPLLEPVFDAAHCVGCGLCEEACPRRARAIRIVPLEDEGA